jgi:cephalosporin hydroxylase
LSHPALAEYVRARLDQHTEDSYMGVPLSKFPEDLRVYEHLLWLDRVDTVIELGTQFGGSALWFRDRMWLMRHHGRIDRPPCVITVDIDQRLAREAGLQEGIVLIEGALDDPDVVASVARQAEGRCLVVEDSAHTFETTTAALLNYSQFVPPAGYFVVEDACVDDERLRRPDWPHGVQAALDAWLQTPAGGAFRVRRDLQLYGVTCHPDGFLQRVPHDLS